MSKKNKKSKKSKGKGLARQEAREYKRRLKYSRELVLANVDILYNFAPQVLDEGLNEEELEARSNNLIENILDSYDEYITMVYGEEDLWEDEEEPSEYVPRPSKSFDLIDEIMTHIREQK